MFEMLGLKSRPAFINYPSGNDTSRDFAGEAPAAAEGHAHAGGCGGGGGCGGKHAHAHA